MKATQASRSEAPAVDLNSSRILDSISRTGRALEDFSVDVGPIRVYFRELERRLIEHIDRADVVLGCVAWLTSAPILQALARKQSVGIVVQKEDFLRPDAGSSKDAVRHLYAAVPCFWRQGGPGITGLLSTSCNPVSAGIRCVGNHNASRAVSRPRAHHKFAIFCRSGADPDRPLEPYAVWTGSFNFTVTAGMSFENAVYIESEPIVQAYLGEWAQVFALSEPLDWETPWMAPEYRIGT